MSRPLCCTENRSIDVEHHSFCECSREKKFKLHIEGLTRTPCPQDAKGVLHLPTPVDPHNYGTWYFHSSCVHNHLDALMRRVALCVPVPIPSRVSQLRQLSVKLGRSLGRMKTYDYEQVISLYGGFRKKRYEAARATISKIGHLVDSRVTMFVKQEGIAFRAGKVNPACRAIQFRNPVFQLENATFIKPIEKRLYQACGPSPFPSGRFIAKEMTPRARANLIYQKFVDMPGCTMLELDATRFDAHVTRPLLGVEHSLYLECINDPFFKRLLKSQLKNKGTARSKNWRLSYSLVGGRMSGDMNTASGNCILMSCMLTLLGQVFNVEYDFLVDGDDSVFFYRGEHMDHGKIKELFLEMGMQIKVENETRNVYNLGFCQSRVVRLNSGLTLIRDPRKVLSKTTINLKFNQTQLTPRLLLTIATGELSLVVGCPVLDPFYRMLIKYAKSNLKSGKGVLRGRSWMEYRQARDFPVDWWRLSVQPITAQARESFALAWGISPSEQTVLEIRFERFEGEIGPIKWRGLGLDVSRWLIDAFSPEYTP